MISFKKLTLHFLFLAICFLILSILIPSFFSPNVAQASPLTHTITATAGANGSIDPSGLTTINEGDDQIFTITPDSGFEIKDVLVDGVLVEEQTFSIAELNNAPMIEEEDVAIPTGTVLITGPYFVVNPQTQAHIAVFIAYSYYAPNRPAQIIAIDTSTKAVSYFEIPPGINVHHRARVITDGKIFFGFNAPAVNIWVYDAVQNTLEDMGIIDPDLGSAIVLTQAQDNKLYGAATYGNQIGIFSFNPETREYHFFGPAGPPHTLGGQAIAYSALMLNNWFYVTSGKVPWYLVAFNIETGEHQTIMEAPAGNYEIYFRREFAVRKPDPDTYELYTFQDGQVTFLESFPDEASLNQYLNAIPYPSTEPTPSPPEVWIEHLIPTYDHPSTFYYRLSELDVWQSVELDIFTYPQNIWRLATLPDGRLLYTPGSWRGNGIYDPQTGEGVYFGKLGVEQFAPAIMHNDKVYLTGYANAPIWEYDPSQRWTAYKSDFLGEPLSETDPESNPRLLLHHFDTRAHTFYSGAPGIDGKIYFCGVIQRQGNGGGFGWWDPQTETADAVDYITFDGQATHHLEPVNQGQQILISSYVTISNITGEKPDTAKMFVYDLQQSAIIHSFEPIPNAIRIGHIIETMPGKIISIAEVLDNLNGKNKSTLFILDTINWEVLLTRELPLPWQVVFPRGYTGGEDFIKGPDGHIWTYMGEPHYPVLVRIHPETTAITVLGRISQRGSIAFSGNILYLGGSEKLRYIPDSLVPQNEEGVLVDGGTLGSYTFSNIIAEHSIEVNFVLNNPYDLDNDNLVNGQDILILLQNWLNGNLGDFNSDSKINSLDYATLINNFNP